jgi:hypothetical protein
MAVKTRKTFWDVEPLVSNDYDVCDHQGAIAKYLILDSPIDTKLEIAQKQRNVVFCAILSQML